jgi:putative ABC transport system ATP-binding protein
MTGAPQLVIADARVTFFKGLPDEKRALDGLDLNLAPGDFAVVIGSNGAGKSTLLNAISGAQILDSGAISINGEDVTRTPAHLRARKIARVFQDPMRGTAAGMSIAENLLLADLRGGARTFARGVTPARRAAWAARLAQLGLGLENRLDTPIDLLSGGQRQSLSLLMAVGAAPDILLLDEHTAALDPKTAAIVMEATAKAVREAKLTTLMVTHNMQHALDYGNRIIMLQAGRVHCDLRGAEKRAATIADLVARFSVKSDTLLLADS